MVDCKRSDMRVEARRLSRFRWHLDLLVGPSPKPVATLEAPVLPRFLVRPLARWMIWFCWRLYLRGMGVELMRQRWERDSVTVVGRDERR